MDVIIVDDEPLARARLQRMLAEEPRYRVVGMAANGEEAMHLVLSQDPDLVLLDIEMPQESGLQVARRLLQLEDPPAVIFCTAHDQHALEAFGVSAVGYLLKPVRQQELFEALAKAQSLSRPQRLSLGQGDDSDAGKTHISANSRRGLELIPLEQVFFFEADQKYVTVHHEQGETLLDDSLKELQETFANRFVRVHRNALVALDRIEAMEKGADGQFVVRLKGTAARPVISRRHVASLRELLTRL